MMLLVKCWFSLVGCVWLFVRVIYLCVIVVCNGVVICVCVNLVCDLKLCRLNFLCRCNRLSMYLKGRWLVLMMLLLLIDVVVLVVFMNVCGCLCF